MDTLWDTSLDSEERKGGQGRGGLARGRGHGQTGKLLIYGRDAMIVLLGVMGGTLSLAGCGSRVEVGEGAVIFLGDSLTSGHNLPGETQLYPEILGEKWGRRVVNFSTSGLRADQALGRYERDINGLEAKEVAACFLVLGANDQISGKSPEEGAKALGEIAEKIRGRGWPVFVVQAIVPLRGGGYRDTYLSLAKAMGTPLSEDIIAAYLREEGGAGDDMVHPSGAGHAMIAESLDDDFGDIMTTGR